MAVSSMRKHSREVVAAQTQRNIKRQCCECECEGNRGRSWFKSFVSDFDVVKYCERKNGTYSGESKHEKHFGVACMGVNSVSHCEKHIVVALNSRLKAHTQ
jgi:hypothetical protein